MTEAEKPTLEEALAVYATNPYWGPEAGTPEKPRRNWLAFDVIRDAARRFSEIEKAVKAGEMALVPVEPTDEMKSAAANATNGGVGRPIPIYKYMLRAHGTDPLISGGGQ